MSRLFTAGLFSLLSVATGCSGGSSSGTVGPGYPPGELALLITDAPFPHDLVASARISIDRVSVERTLPGGATERTVLMQGETREFEITSLRNGVVAEVFRVPLATEEYQRLYLNFSSVELTLEDGRVFRSDDGTMLMPEVGPDGCTVPFEVVLHVPPGKLARMLLDVDLTRCFAPTGGVAVESATSFTFNPMIHGVMQGWMSEVRGIVAQDGGKAGPQPVDRATVYFLPPGTSNIDQAYASTASGPDGAYCQLGLPPGPYRVLAVKGTQQCWVETASVPPGQYANAELIFD